MKLERIVVAVDGSDNSLAAVRWTAGLAAATGAEVVAVHATGLLDQLQGGDDEIGRRLASTWCEPLESAGIPLRAVVRDGHPVAVVLAVADEEDVDLIVLGSRGIGAYPEQLLGSTSTQVAQRSDRPVTIVPLAVRVPT